MSSLPTSGEALPFLKIPAKSYRLFLAFAMLPLALAAWMLKAGSARLLSILFGGKVAYEQWLKLACFGFFPFWIAFVLLDMVYSGFLGNFIVPALQMEYGSLAKAFFLYFPQVFYPVLLSLGGFYSGIAARQVEGFAIWKSALIGAVTFAWPTLLVAVLFR